MSISGFPDEGHAELWQRICAFRFDEEGVQRTFAGRLADENVWSASYTERVIEEYRRFLFLSVVSEHVVTPSEDVDQVWHLHMCYTRSYWDGLCGTVLKQPLHHNPSLGGGNENRRYRQFYLDTLKSYERIFGEKVPADIWPDADKRFGRQDFKRIDCTRNLVIQKSKVRALALGILGSLLFVGCASAALGHGEIPWALVVVGIIVLVLVIGSSGGGKGGKGGRGGGGCGGCGHSCGSGCGGCGGD
ncbi:MAG: glycine-rich domain-containing protein [Opitutales bacterium]